MYNIPIDRVCVFNCEAIGVINDAVGGVEVYAVLALIPILLYNGQRGRQTKVMQYGFYIFYPAHLLLIAALYHLFIL